MTMIMQDIAEARARGMALDDVAPVLLGMGFAELRARAKRNKMPKHIYAQLLHDVLCREVEKY